MQIDACALCVPADRLVQQTTIGPSISIPSLLSGTMFIVRSDRVLRLPLEMDATLRILVGTPYGTEEPIFHRARCGASIGNTPLECCTLVREPIAVPFIRHMSYDTKLLARI